MIGFTFESQSFKTLTDEREKLKIISVNEEKAFDKI